MEGNHVQDYENNDDKEDMELPAFDLSTIIQGTDNDASLSRLSAVQMGYLEDVFAPTLTPSGGGSSGSRRFPIINRGKIFI